MQGRPFNVQVQNSDRIDAEDGCTFRHNVEQEIGCTPLERDFREETTTYGNTALGVIEQLHSRSGKKRLIRKMLLENALFFKMETDDPESTRNFKDLPAMKTSTKMPARAGPATVRTLNPSASLGKSWQSTSWMEAVE
ncbi:hypothetical protein MTO96_041454 [Rhipicephalus appendiculatus]